MLKNVKILILSLFCLWSIPTLHADDVTYRVIHTEAINELGQSGMLNAIVSGETDTAAVLQSVTALRIVGTLNSTDCLILRNKLLNLQHLDMTDVEFVAGGSAYYSNRTTQPGVFPAYLFNSCVVGNKLVTVKLPNSVHTVDVSAFNGCSQLKHLTFGENIEHLSQLAFNKCVQIDTLILPVRLKTLGVQTFNECSALRGVVIPDSVTSVANSCFSSCAGIRTVELGASVQKIEQQAFRSCTKLDSIVFNRRLKSIESNAFNSCGSIVEIQLPDSLENVGERVFSNCGKLKVVRFPASVTSFGKNLFNSSRALQEVHVAHLNPIELDPEVFVSGSAGNYCHAKLFVPNISYYSYYWDNTWGCFHEIVPEVYNYPDIQLTSNGVLDAVTGGLGYTPTSLQLETMASFSSDESIVQHFDRIIMKADAFSYATVMADGNVTTSRLEMEIPLKARQWKLLALPQNVAVASLPASPSSLNMYTYNGNNRAGGATGWESYVASKEGVATGYAVYSASATTLKLVLTGADAKLQENDVNRAIGAYAVANEALSGWNLVGNPFMSYYDIADLGISDPIIILNGATGDYETYYPGVDHYVLSPFEGFFVKQYSAGRVTFLKSKRQMYKLGANSRQPRTLQQGTSALTPPEPMMKSSVTVSCDPAEAGSVTGSGYYLVGHTATLTVTPAEHYELDHWTCNGTYYAGAVSTIDYTVEKRNVSFVAVMRATDDVSASYDPSNPSDPNPLTPQNTRFALNLKVSPANCGTLNIASGTLVESGSMVTLKCTPKQNFVFRGWYQSGTLISTDAQFNYEMPYRATTLLAVVAYSPTNPDDPNHSQSDVDSGQGIILGDVNDDGTVDVSDAVTLVKYLKDASTPPEKLVELRCDVNFDHVVNVEDATAIVGMYLERTYFSSADTLARQDTIADEIAISSITLEPGGSHQSVQLNLTTSGTYTAMAFDICLPEGMEADTARLVSPVATHLLSYSLLQDGGQVLRMVCFSTDNTPLPSTLTLFLGLPLSAPPYAYPSDVTVTMRHAVFIQPDAKQLVPQCQEGTITVSEHSHIPMVISAVNKYNTIVLPFHATLPEGVRAATVSSVNDTCLFLKEVDVLEPFHPYIVFAATGVCDTFVGDYRTDLYVPSVTIDNLTGVLHNTTISDGYVMQNQGAGATFYPIIGDVVLPAGKCYLKRTGGSGSAAVHMVLVDENSGAATSIEPCQEMQDASAGIFYNLQGQPVAHPVSSGLYIGNKRKIIVIE